MQRSLLIKILTIVATILVCIYGIIGIPKSKEELIANWNHNIRLGLDLRGGSQLMLQVQVQDAFKAEADQVIDRLKDQLRNAGINYTSLDRNEPASIADASKIEVTIKGLDATKAGNFRSIVTDNFQQWNLTAVNSTDYRLNLKTSEVLAMRRDTVTRTMNTIENRINGLGLAESSVQQSGRTEDEAEILVQLPGVDDPARIKQILQTAALLEITEVREGPFAGRDAALAQFGGVLPLNTKLVKQGTRTGESAGDAWYLVTRIPVITGRDLRDSRPAQDPSNGSWETSFVLSQDGARRFERFTEANIGKRLAVVLDNNIRSVATIQSKIGDSGRISNIGSQQDASDLSLVLRAGSLPAGILYGEERTVGPSLGADSIQQGMKAGIVGISAVILVMLLYYKRAGINATLALVLNAVILIAVLAYFDAVLTLPGIAGIILTIGMAVDSNVLIFERIREELRAGKAVPAAIEAGFGKAWWTIVDTHVTTIVSCAFLFIFGTTAVKGFAVTLVIGLLANIFTAVFVSKVIFEWELSGKRQVTALSI
jgi:preprotein translocase subunit SecD